MDTTEIIKIDLEVFNNLTKMLKSKNNEDAAIAIETIKNIDPSNEMIKLLLKKTAYAGRKDLLDMMGTNSWSYNDLTMSEIYDCIRNSKENNIENLKEIYESLVIEHFTHLTEDYDFIDSKYTIKW